MPELNPFIEDIFFINRFTFVQFSPEWSKAKSSISAKTSSRTFAVKRLLVLQAAIFKWQLLFVSDVNFF